MASIELHFKAATSSSAGAGNGVGLASHAYIVYRDDDGHVIGYSRGGPEAARTGPPTGPGVF